MGSQKTISPVAEGDSSDLIIAAKHQVFECGPAQSPQRVVRSRLALVMPNPRPLLGRPRAEARSATMAAELPRKAEEAHQARIGAANRLS